MSPKSPSTSPVAKAEKPQRGLARIEHTELAEALGTHLPALVATAGPPAVFAYEEFLLGTLANGYTRAAYARAVERFLAWCEASGLQLPRIAPKDVGGYRDELLRRFSAASVKLHLAAIRHFFDLLVTRHVVILHPAATVRGPRYQTVEGKTQKLRSSRLVA